MNVLVHHLAYIVDKFDLVCLERSETGLIESAYSSWYLRPSLQGLRQLEAEGATRYFKSSIRASRAIENWRKTPLGYTLDPRNWRKRMCNAAAQRNANLSPPNVHDSDVQSFISNQTWSVWGFNPRSVCTSCGGPLDANGFCQRCLESFFDFEAYESTYEEGIPKSPTTTIPTVELTSASPSHRQ